MIRELIETLRQPEYTGENRCPPCTVVNVAIAAALGAVLSRRSKRAGAFAVVASVAVIYLRGYLVPGTPELTKRYLPPAVLEWFGKSPEPDLATGVADSGRSETEGDGTKGRTPSGDARGSSDGASAPNDDLETYFLDAGILEPCADRDDLCLTPSFESEWIDAIDSIEREADSVAAVVEAFGFDSDPEAFELAETEDGAYVLRDGSRDAAKWPSYAAFVADLAAESLLDSWVEGWNGYQPQQKGQILNSLRMFLETCPTAEGGVRMSEDVVESCCTSSTVIAVVCEETGDRIFEHRISGDPSRLRE